jgi:hypothetical protein
MIYLKARKRFGFNNNNSRYNTTSIYKLIAENYFPEADVVVGGFPCQSFSHSGKRRGFEDDKGHDLKEAVNANGENSRVRCIKVSWRLFGGLNLKCLLRRMYGL